MNKLAATLFICAVQAVLVQNVAASLTFRDLTREDFVCPGEGNFAIPGECTSNYYICVEGEAYPAACPNGAIFDPITLRCVPPDQASCSNVTTTTQPSTTQSGGFTCPDNGNFPIPGTCGPNYFICVDGTAYPATCPGGAIFDPQTLVCVPPGSASCEGGTTATSTPSSNTTSGPFVCPQPDGFFANPDECESYYVCTSGRPILQYCPPSLVFNPELSRCDYPLNVPECAPFRCPEPEGSFANPEDCSTFWTCSNNRPVLQECPPSLVFNPDIGTCDFLDNVPNCQNVTTTSTTRSRFQLYNIY